MGTVRQLPRRMSEADICRREKSKKKEKLKKRRRIKQTQRDSNEDGRSALWKCRSFATSVSATYAGIDDPTGTTTATRRTRFRSAVPVERDAFCREITRGGRFGRVGGTTITGETHEYF